MRRLTPLFGPLAAASLLGGPLACASADPSRALVVALEKQVNELRAQVARHDERLGLLATDVQVMREGSRADEKPPSSLEVVRLGPQAVAEPAPAPPTPEEPEEEPVVLELTGDDERLAVVQMPPPPQVPRTPSTARGEARPASDLTADTELRTALTRYREGDAEEAYRSLAELVRRRPTGSTAEQARYWMGEIQFELARYRVAIDDYMRLREDFPRGSKAVDALLKLGLAYERVGDLRRAHAAFSELVEHHPNSAGAELARKKVKP